MRSYTEYILEKRQPRESQPAPTQDPVYWGADSVSRIKKIAGKIISIGGLGSIDKISNAASNLGSAAESGISVESMKEFLKLSKDLFTSISDLPTREWPMTNQPVVYALKDASDITLQSIDAISTRTSSSVLNPSDRDTPSARFGAEFNRVFSRGSSRLNSFISSLGGNNENPSSYLNNAKISLYSLDSDIKNLESLIASIKTEQNSNSLSGITSELNGIKEMVEGRIKTLETKTTLTGQESRSIIKGAEEQSSKLAALKSRFFSDFSSILQKSESEKTVDRILKQAEEKIKQAEDIIISSKEARRVFQGFERGNLDDRIDSTIRRVQDKRNGTDDKQTSKQDPVDRTNKRRVKIDDLSQYIGVPKGDYEVPSDTLDILLGN